MTLNIYLLSRIVKTANPNYYRFIWDDGYEQTNLVDWGGYFRGAIGGYDANGEYERWDNRLGEPHFPPIIVAEKFVEDGGVIEDYVPPEEPEEE